MKQKQPDISLSAPTGYKESVVKDSLREIHFLNNHDAVRILSSRDVIELLNGAIERKRQEAPEGQSRELLESISTVLKRSHEMIKSHASLPRMPDDASLNLHAELDIMDQHLDLLAQDNQAGQIQLLSTLVNLAEKQLGNIELPNDERKTVKTNLGLPSLESISEVSINTMQWVVRFRLVTSEMLKEKQKQLEKNPTDENLQKDIKRLQNTLARTESILTAANEYQKKFLPILKPIENLTTKKASAETMLPMRTLATKIISYDMNPNKQISDYKKLMQSIEQEKKSLQKKADSFFTSKEEKKQIESFITGLNSIQTQIRNEARTTFAATEQIEASNTGQNPLASKQKSKSSIPNPLKTISKAIEPITTRASAGAAVLSSTAQMLGGVLAKVDPVAHANNAKNTIVAAGKTLAILVEGVDTVTLAQTAKVAREHVAGTMDKTKRIKETKLTDKAESTTAEAMRSSTTDAAQRVSGSSISGIISDAAKTVTSVANTVTSSVSDLKSAAASRFTKSATTPTVRPDPTQVLANVKTAHDNFKQAQSRFIEQPMVASTSSSTDLLQDMVTAKNKYFEAAAQLPDAIKAAGKGQLKSDLTKEYVDFKRDKDSTELYVKGFEAQAQAAKARVAPSA